MAGHQPTARDRLKPQAKPYWKTLAVGELHLGYRRRRKESPGYWIARTYAGRDAGGVGRYFEKTLGLADDFRDADGVDVLSYGEAQRLAHGRKPGERSGKLTVADAVHNYVAYLRAIGKTADESRAKAHILPKLGTFEVKKLTAAKIRSWLASLVESPALARTAKGEPRRYKAAPNDVETQRRRRSSANRVLTILKAALNHAYDEGKVASNDAWGRRVKPYRAVDVARIRFLTVAEARRLINASEPAFRSLVEAALQTGARYGELIRLKVEDFNPDNRTVHVRKSKSGKARHIVLTDEGAAFFARMTLGRPGDALMFLREDGSEWRASQQDRPMDRANAAAKLSPPIVFHGLRHTYASLCVMNGVPLMVVAANLGHTGVGMVSKHYGHLAPSFVTDAIQRGAPRFGTVEPTNVKPLSPGRARMAQHLGAVGSEALRLEVLADQERARQEKRR